MKKRRILLSVLALVLVTVLCAALFVACDPNKPTDKYTITFVDGNPATVEVKVGESLTAEQIPTYTGTVPAGQEFEHWVVAGEDDAPTETVVGVGYQPTANVKAVAAFKAHVPTVDDFVGVWADDVNHVMISITKGVNGSFAFAGFVDQTDVSVTEGDAYDASANKFTLKNGDIVDTPTKTYEFTVEGDNVTLVFHDSSNLDAIQEKTYTLGRRTGGNFVGAYAYSPAYKIEIVAGDYVLGYNYPYARVIEQEGVKKLEYLRTSGLDYDDFAVVGEGLVIDDQPYVKNGTYVDSKSQAETYEASIRIYTVDSANYYVLSYGGQFYFNVQLDVEIAGNATVIITYGDSQTLKVKFDERANYFTILFNLTGVDGNIEYDGQNYKLSGETLTVNPLDDTLVYSATKAYKLDVAQSTYAAATADAFATAKYNLQDANGLYIQFDGVGRITVGNTQGASNGFYAFDADENTIEFDCENDDVKEGPFDIYEDGNVLVYVYSEYSYEEIEKTCIFVKEGYTLTDRSSGFFGYWKDAQNHSLFIYEDQGSIVVDSSLYNSPKPLSKNYNGSVLTSSPFSNDDYEYVYWELTLNTAKGTLTLKELYYYYTGEVSSATYTYVGEVVPGFENAMLGTWTSGDSSLTIEVTEEEIVIGNEHIALEQVNKARLTDGSYTYTFTCSDQQYVLSIPGVLIAKIGADTTTLKVLYPEVNAEIYEQVVTYKGNEDNENAITLVLSEDNGVVLNGASATHIAQSASFMNAELYFYIAEGIDIFGVTSGDFKLIYNKDESVTLSLLSDESKTATLTEYNIPFEDSDPIIGFWKGTGSDGEQYTLKFTVSEEKCQVVLTYVEWGSKYDVRVYKNEDGSYYVKDNLYGERPTFTISQGQLIVSNASDYDGTYSPAIELLFPEKFIGKWTTESDPDIIVEFCADGKVIINSKEATNLFVEDDELSATIDGNDTWLFYVPNSLSAPWLTHGDYYYLAMIAYVEQEEEDPNAEIHEKLNGKWQGFQANKEEYFYQYEFDGKGGLKVYIFDYEGQSSPEYTYSGTYTIAEGKISTVASTLRATVVIVDDNHITITYDGDDYTVARDGYIEKVVTPEADYVGIWEASDYEGSYTIELKADHNGTYTLEMGGDPSENPFTWTYIAADGTISTTLFSGTAMSINSAGKLSAFDMQFTKKEVTPAPTVPQEAEYYGTWTVHDGDGEYEIVINQAANGGTLEYNVDPGSYEDDIALTSFTWTYAEGKITFTASNINFTLSIEDGKCYLTVGTWKCPTACTKTASSESGPQEQETDYQSLIQGAWKYDDSGEQTLYTFTFDGNGQVTIAWQETYMGGEDGSTQVAYTVDAQGNVSFNAGAFLSLNEVTGTISADGKLTLTLWEDECTLTK